MIYPQNLVVNQNLEILRLKSHFSILFPVITNQQPDQPGHWMIHRDNQAIGAFFRRAGQVGMVLGGSIKVRSHFGPLENPKENGRIIGNPRKSMGKWRFTLWKTFTKNELERSTILLMGKLKNLRLAGHGFNSYVTDYQRVTTRNAGE